MKKIITIALLLFPIVIFSQTNNEFFEHRLGQRGVTILTGFSLCSINYSNNYTEPFYKNPSALTVFCVGANIVILGILPDKHSRIYTRQMKCNNNSHICDKLKKQKKKSHRIE